MLKIKVDSNDSLIRIDKYLINKLNITRSQISKIIENNQVLVNGNIIKTNYKVNINDNIEVDDNFNSPLKIKKQDIDFKVMFEDDSLIIINKPSGLVVHPGNGNPDGTLVNGLLNYTSSLSDNNGEFRPGIVHRIDKDTSGILIVAKNNVIHEKLAKMISTKQIKREYTALLIGEFKHDSATIDAPIGRDRANRKMMSVTSINSKNAVTHLTVIKKFKGYTLVKLILETGRTHQIRVHMKYIGYPIYNDPLYTTNKTDHFGQFLHSSHIEFVHPITNELISIECELPKEFINFLKTLEVID